MSRRKRKPKSAAKPLFIFLVLVAIFAVVAYGSLKNFNEPFNPQTSETIHIVVESGMGTTAIGQMLEDSRIIKNAVVFKWKSKFKQYDGKYQAGSFELSSSMPMEDIMTALMDGKKETTRFTIPEGYTLKQTAQKLSQEGLVDEAEFMNQLKNGDFEYRFLDGLKKEENRLEGFLFPDTYEIFTDASEKDVINKMLSGFDLVFTDEYYKKATEMNFSVKEIVTIASLIEEETKADKERKRVSSVVYNRLSIDMKLQFDSSVLYALGEQKDRVLYSDLEIDSPYNTYKHEGLPPGPISSPGIACLEAALYPEDTDYLYFVLKADGSGENNFAKTYNEFLNYKEDYINTFQ
jgi:UPF0755 protein